MNPNTLESKKQIVEKISNSFKDAGSMVIVEYRGLSVSNLNDLRKSLKAVDASFNVYKNTLVSKAVAGLENVDLNQYLSGSNGFVFSKDVVNGPKALVKFAKKNENLVIKAGLVEGKVVDAAQIKSIATLPGREGLISMFLSCMQAPIRSFACTVKAVADSKN